MIQFDDSWGEGAHARLAVGWGTVGELMRCRGKTIEGVFDYAAYGSVVLGDQQDCLVFDVLTWRLVAHTTTLKAAEAAMRLMIL